jgi:NDP-sugar pyrophosphorylase family protein
VLGRSGGSLNTIRQALILAGGKGTRLAPLGEYLPKCLATVYNRPLIDYSLRLLETASVTDVYIAVSKRHHSVVSACVRLLERNIRIHLLDEKLPAGMRALFEAGRKMPSEPFLFLLGDIYFGSEYMAPITLPDRIEMILFSHLFDDPARLSAETANLVCDGQTILEIRDKPQPKDVKGFFGWNAMGILTPEFLARESAIFEWLAANRSEPAIGDLFSAAVALGTKMEMLPGPEGAWINVNSPDQLLRAGSVEQQKYLKRLPR